MFRTLFSGKLYSKVSRSSIIALCLVLLVITAASAHFLGGKFRHTRGTWLYLEYTQSGLYATVVDNAARAWHNTPTRPWITKTTNYAISELDFYTQYRADTWWGLAVHHPCSGSGCTYVWADLYLNSRTLAGTYLCATAADFIRQKVAVHEMGHGLGLAHVASTDATRSIMKQGCLTYNIPQTHDINDVNILYP